MPCSSSPASACAACRSTRKTLPDRSDIAAIVLAAGSSHRFGSDKLLHPLTRKGATLPLAAHSLQPWLDAFAQVTVVVRPGSEAFRDAIAAALGAATPAALRWSVCEDAEQGMA